MTADDLARAAARTATRLADGGGVDDSERPYKVLGPNKIWMSKTARAFARQYGLSDREMARYLMQRERLRESGVTDVDVLPPFGEVSSDDS